MAHSEPHLATTADQRSASVRTLIGWFSAQLALAVAGAGISLFGFWPGLGLALLTLIGSGLTLYLGWQPDHTPSHQADSPDKKRFKTVSDSLAIVGLIVFAGLIFTVGILPALLVLLLLAQLAINLVTEKPSLLFYGLVNGFAFLLLGAAESTSGGYLLIIAGYAFCVVMTLSVLWCVQATTDSRISLIRQRATHEDLLLFSTATHPPESQVKRSERFKPSATILAAALLVICAGVIYLFLPRLPAANLGSQLSRAATLYNNVDWQAQAKRVDLTSQDEHSQTHNKGQANDLNQDQLNSDLSDSPLPLWEGLDPSAAQFDYRGFRDEMNLNDSPYGNNTTTADLNQIIALMKAPHGSYLKVRTFDHFDGLRWISSVTAFRKQETDRWGNVVLAGEQIDSGNFQQQITLKQGMSAWLPAAADPVALWLPAVVMATDAFGQPVLPAPLQANTQYTVLSRQQLVDNRPASYTPKPRDHDLQLPYNLDDRIPLLAQSVTANAHTPYHQAQALEQHLRSEYRYSFDSALTSQGVTPLPAFLFKSREAHCEYFASAMVILLRTLKIPARLVTGFSASQQNPLTGYFEIRGIDGHAWAEAWIDNRWVTFEPTAFYQLPASQASTLSADQINDYVDSLSQRQQALSADNTFTVGGLLTTLWNALYLLLVIPISYLLLALFWLWPVLLLLLIIAVAAYLGRRYWWHQWWRKVAGKWVIFRLQRYQPQDTGTALGFYLRQLQWLGAANGVTRQPGQHLEKWCQALQQQLPKDTSNAALMQLKDLLNAYWYGSNKASAGINLPAQLQPDLIDLVKALTDAHPHKADTGGEG